MTVVTVMAAAAFLVCWPMCGFLAIYLLKNTKDGLAVRSVVDAKSLVIWGLFSLIFAVIQILLEYTYQLILKIDSLFTAGVIKIANLIGVDSSSWRR